MPAGPPRRLCRPLPTREVVTDCGVGRPWREREHRAETEHGTAESVPYATSKKRPSTEEGGPPRPSNGILGNRIRSSLPRLRHVGFCWGPLPEAQTDSSPIREVVRNWLWGVPTGTRYVRPPRPDCPSRFSPCGCGVLVPARPRPCPGEGVRRARRIVPFVQVRVPVRTVKNTGPMGVQPLRRRGNVTICVATSMGWSASSPIRKSIFSPFSSR